MLKPTLIAALALAPAAPAAAQGGAWQVGRDAYHVYAHDLDLNSAGGRATLLARVERAAGRVCAMPTRGEQAECVAATVAQAGGLVRRALAERDAIVVAAR